MSNVGTVDQTSPDGCTQGMNERNQSARLHRIIPVAFEARWREPLLIIQKHEVEMISGPADAIRYIRKRFCDHTSPLYSRALSICFASLRREADVDISRTFFLAAYEDHLLSHRASR